MPVVRFWFGVSGPALACVVPSVRPLGGYGTLHLGSGHPTALTFNTLVDFINGAIVTNPLRSDHAALVSRFAPGRLFYGSGTQDYCSIDDRNMTQRTSMI